MSPHWVPILMDLTLLGACTWGPPPAGCPSLGTSDCSVPVPRDQRSSLLPLTTLISNPKHASSRWDTPVPPHCPSAGETLGTAYFHPSHPEMGTFSVRPRAVSSSWDLSSPLHRVRAHHPLTPTRLRDAGGCSSPGDPGLPEDMWPQS